MTARPVTLLIAALGGEGGGVLTDWVVSAAMAENYPVQSTSIPGVAQRTGATTYYVELFPRTRDALGERDPVMGLYPAPANVDVMVASELVEAARAMENGYVTPERTTLIASRHRVYAIAEKAAMGDGPVDSQRILNAAEKLAKRTIIADCAALAHSEKTVLNAVLLGLVAGSGVLPMRVETFETAVRESGVAVESNLRGFHAGIEFARGERRPVVETHPAMPDSLPPRPGLDDLLERVTREYPADLQNVVQEGVKRVADYQDTRYAAEYLERLGPIVETDRVAGAAGKGFALSRETGRHLALWMTYEDVIRVADLKSRSARYARVRREAGAGPDEPVRVTEFLKPGVDEVASLLPPVLGSRLEAWAGRRPSRSRLHIPMRVRTDTVTGYLRVRLLARLRRWRPRSYRFAKEQALMRRWLDAILAAAARDYGLACEIAECARLLKGYSDTHMRGCTNFLRIFEEVVEPALRAEGDRKAAVAAARVRDAREAALADPDGEALSAALVGATPQRARPAKETAGVSAA